MPTINTQQNKIKKKTLQKLLAAVTISHVYAATPNNGLLLRLAVSASLFISSI
jgi:hypothetical protein